ncbi:MAG: squalene synthase HpnC [Planctomycetes bacterium]|nr:squalene synthase HpnC [Planctomycetota bacterium]
MAGIPRELVDAYRRCEQLATRRLENFPVLSEYLPAELIPHFAAVYAYCRRADDAGDESPSPAQALAALDELEAEVHRCFDGTPKTPEMAALAHTIAVKRLPKQPFLDLLSAFRQDQTKTRYESWEELLNYCKRSADPVGRLVLALLGEAPSDERKGALSDAICTGLQMANFWQDVGPDLKKGRIYIPADLMARHGVREADLAAASASPALRAALKDLCDRTDPLFSRGAALADLVEKKLRIPILAFAIAGQELLKRIREVDYDVLARRPSAGDLPLKTILAKAAAARFLPFFRPKSAP